MKLGEMSIDVVKQEQGDWVDNIPELPGVRFKTRGANNKDWRKLSNRLLSTVPRSERIDGISPAHQDRINCALLAETAILDWDGIEGDDGKPIAFSKKGFHDLIVKPEMQRLREGALWAANMVAERRGDEAKADAGN